MGERPNQRVIKQALSPPRTRDPPNCTNGQIEKIGEKMGVGQLTPRVFMRNERLADDPSLASPPQGTRTRDPPKTTEDFKENDLHTHITTPSCKNTYGTISSINHDRTALTPEIQDYNLTPPPYTPI